MLHLDIFASTPFNGERRNLGPHRAFIPGKCKEQVMAATGKAENIGKSNADLEADIRQLKADIEQLTRQLATTGEHGYGAAKRAATESVEQLRAQGEAALGSLRGSAQDIEAQIVASVREKPVTSLAIAAGVGFLFALLTRR
jgi:ElaB/YqjD/DUF883 family membrane-anchored ribosome-binding protein